MHDLTSMTSHLSFLHADWELTIPIETWDTPPYTNSRLTRLEGQTIPIIGRQFFIVPATATTPESTQIHTSELSDARLLKVGDIELKDEARMTILAHHVFETINASASYPSPKIPRVHAFIHLPESQNGLLLDYIHGPNVSPLSTLWQDLSSTQHNAIKDQLCDILFKMRRFSFEYIGRPGREPYTLPSIFGPIKHRFCFGLDAMKEWNDSRKDAIDKNEALDEGHRNSLRQQQIELARARGTKERFVLTHGDLSDRNILVDSSSDPPRIIALIDWETANVLPTYFEYVAARLSGGHDPYWRKALLEVLEGVLQKECKETGDEFQKELSRWKGLVDVERHAQGLNDDCAWTFESEE
ncbi:hypothetical protein ABKN59_009102 [Abortiporus biennis]